MSGGQIKGKSVPFFEGIPFGVYDVLLPNSDGHFRLEARDDCYGDDKWRKIANMINEAKNIGVMTKSLSRNPFKRGEPEENTKLAILIVENGIKNENGED